MITLQVNIAMNGYKVGDKIKLKTDSNGIILDTFWRNRLKDASQDGCVEIFQIDNNQDDKKIKKGNK